MRISGASESSGCLGLSRLGKAEGVGFEPTEAFTSPVFKTGAINHSTTPPGTTLVFLIVPWARAIESSQVRDH